MTAAAAATTATSTNTAAIMSERLGSFPVVTAAGALFCVALVFLALQMRAGADPAIGAGSKAEAANARPVIVRRVIVRRIVEEAPGGPAPTAPAPRAAPAPEPGAARFRDDAGLVMKVRIPVTRVDESFGALRSTIRIAIVAPDARGLVVRARDAIRDFEACASRFRPDSELCALNADPRAVVPASRRLRDAVRAALWAAERSGGLVDPCLLDALEAAGYRRSLARDELISPAETNSSHAGRPARPHPAARWRHVRVDDLRGTIERPPGFRLDLGGSGKGPRRRPRREHARLGSLLGRRCRRRRPRRRSVRGARRAPVRRAARRSAAARQRRSGDFEHRAPLLVDRGGRNRAPSAGPATGRPAWTGLLAVTALAPTTLEAETLSKAALLSGPERARRLLARHGGVMIHARGEVEPVGPLPVDGGALAPVGQVALEGAGDCSALAPVGQVAFEGAGDGGVVAPVGRLRGGIERGPTSSLPAGARPWSRAA